MIFIKQHPDGIIKYTYANNYNFQTVAAADRILGFNLNAMHPNIYKSRLGLNDPDVYTFVCKQGKFVIPGRSSVVLQDYLVTHLHDSNSDLDELFLSMYSCYKA